MRHHSEYDAAAKFLHWLPFFLILFQFPLGWFMPPTGRDEIPTASVNLHFSMGVLILSVVLVRLAWRIARPVEMMESLADWQKKLAHSAHWMIYLVLFGTTLTGWFHASVRGWPIRFFGLFPVPPICPQGSETAHFIGELHKHFGRALLALIVVHIAGVLFHEFVQDDRLLVRILPRWFTEWQQRKTARSADGSKPAEVRAG